MSLRRVCTCLLDTGTFQFTCLFRELNTCLLDTGWLLSKEKHILLYYMYIPVNMNNACGKI